MWKRERWADMVDEAGDVPVETINYPGGIVQFHSDLPERSKRMHDLVHEESVGGVVKIRTPSFGTPGKMISIEEGPRLGVPPEKVGPLASLVPQSILVPGDYVPMTSKCL